MPIDYSEYPDNWHNISSDIRYRRAGNCCETCGARNGKPHPTTGSKVVLTVAHINHIKSDCRYNKREYIKGDRSNNLVAECQRCHLNRDRWRHNAKRKYGRDYDKEHQLTLNL